MSRGRLSFPSRAARRSASGSPVSVLCIDLVLQIPREEATVTVLQVRALPVTSVDDSAALGCTAAAGHLPVVVVEQRVVSGQLFPFADVSHGYQHDVPADAYIGRSEEHTSELQSLR